MSSAVFTNDTCVHVDMPDVSRTTLEIYGIVYVASHLEKIKLKKLISSEPVSLSTIKSHRGYKAFRINQN